MSTQLPETFDPETQDGNTWDLLPIGEYAAAIVEIAVAQPKSGDGYYVAVTWKIDEGEYEGRQIWQRITYIHSSGQAQTIGRKQLKDLCNACGRGSEHVEDVEVFLFKRAKIKVGVERDKDGVYDDKNKVTRIRPLDETPTSPAAVKPPSQAAAPPPQTAKPQSKAGPKSSAPWHA
jgi:Protein of unknown function (DUF669)